jgi:hypothetical protein
MPRAGFEPAILVFESSEMVHALDGAASLIYGKYRQENNPA